MPYASASRVPSPVSTSAAVARNISASSAEYVESASVTWNWPVFSQFASIRSGKLTSPNTSPLGTPSASVSSPASPKRWTLLTASASENTSGGTVSARTSGESTVKTRSTASSLPASRPRNGAERNIQRKPITFSAIDSSVNSPTGSSPREPCSTTKTPNWPGTASSR